MELLPEGQKNTKEVLWEDQQRINEFSKLINRRDGWSVELEKLKQEKEYLDDVSLEIELIDEDEKIGYKLGDTFVQMRQAQVVAKLETESEKLDEKVSHLESQIDETDSLLNALKTQLYAKFGNAINLERAAGNPYSLVLNGVALVVCYWGLKTVTNYELPLVLASAGHKQFLTILSLFVSIATFALSVLCHLTKSQKLFTLKNDIHAIATTLETIVSGVYWPLKLFFIKMILDREKIAPLSVDLAIHLVPTVTLLIDFYCFMPNWKVNDGAAMFIVALLTVAYWQWLNYVMDETSVFPYPFLNVSFKARLLIFDVLGSMAFANFLLQKWIYRKVIRGAAVAEEKVEEVVDIKKE